MRSAYHLPATQAIENARKGQGDQAREKRNQNSGKETTDYTTEQSEMAAQAELSRNCGKLNGLLHENVLRESMFLSIKSV